MRVMLKYTDTVNTVSDITPQLSFGKANARSNEN